MALYGSVDRASSFNQEKALKIFRDDVIREMLWTSATKNRIHRRIMGSLLEKRRKLEGILNRNDILPIPDWVYTIRARPY
ncbi:MAG: hypothetical protein HPY50_04200 [Firmicutes bacterium]|nr:hypothetical protein [Bacillota bacterium]